MSISKVARFKIKASHLQEAKSIIQDFLQAVSENERGKTLLYKSFHYKTESNSFLHLMTFKNAKAEEAHRNASYTQDFVEKLYPLCSEKPQFDTLEELTF